MRRRIWSTILALALIFSLIPSTVLAANDFTLANGGTCLSGYDGPGGDVVVPGGITEIAQAFTGSTDITSVTLPEGVVTVGLQAFSGCTSLERVVLPSTVRNIKNMAFTGCTSLREIVIPEGVVTLESVFGGCTSLERVELPRSLRAIEGYGTFEDCVSLREITLPQGLETLGGGIFQNCTALTSLTIPTSVSKLGSDIFEGCTNLSQVTVGDRVVNIGAGEKKNYTHLGTAGELDTAFVVEDHVQVAPDTYADHVLTKYLGNGGDVVVPDGVEVLDGLLFKGRTDITSVTLPEGLKVIDLGAFMGCTALERINLPDSITEIGWAAFENCSSLKEVVLPAGLTVLSDGLFSGCTSLERVIIPEGVTTLGVDGVSGVFRYCSSLSSITFPTTMKYSGGNYSINGVDTDGTIAQAPLVFFRKQFEGCVSLEQIVNNPHPELAKNMENNLPQYKAWANPGQHLNPQSDRVTAQAKEIVGSETDPYEKVRAICKWVSVNIKYDEDYYEGRKSSVVVDVEGVLTGRLTVCEGYTRLTSALIQAAGIPCMSVSGPARGSHGWENHAWNEVFVDGRWVIVDNTWGSSHFDVGIVCFSADHKYASRPSASADNTPSSWAKSETWEAICADLVPGDLQGSYRSEITREEFCRLMVALVEQKSGQSIDAYLSAKGLRAANAFTDTESAPVLAAHALGIVSGTGDGSTFTPAGAITRQEAAVMLSRTAKALGVQPNSGATGERFQDKQDFAPWAAEDIAFLSSLADAAGRQVMGSTGNGSFSPLASYSREQAILTAMRLFQVG